LGGIVIGGGRPSVGALCGVGRPAHNSEGVLLEKKLIPLVSCLAANFFEGKSELANTSFSSSETLNRDRSISDSFPPLFEIQSRCTENRSRIPEDFLVSENKNMKGKIGAQQKRGQITAQHRPSAGCSAARCGLFLTCQRSDWSGFSSHAHHDCA
jgi:hypothetical protein